MEEENLSLRERPAPVRRLHRQSDKVTEIANRGSFFSFYHTNLYNHCDFIHFFEDSSVMF